MKKLLPSLRLARTRATAYGAVVAAERAFYERAVGPGMVVFDVGANRGDLSALFSELVEPGGRVFAFEPGPAFDILAELASTRPNLTIERAAVFERSGRVTLNVYDSEHDSWSTLAERAVKERGTLVLPIARKSVLAVALDEYCARHGIERIDLLKLDVEGAELQALRGSSRMFRERRISACIFEVGETTFDMGNDPAELLAFFKNVGFAVENIVGGDPVLPAGGHSFSMHHAFPMP